jgi:uncharacterized membrane protein
VAEPLIGEHPPDRRQTIEHWRTVCLVCTLLLIGLGLGWELWWAPLKGGTGALALKVLPLTLCIAGMLKHQMRAYRAMSLLVWLYVLEGLMRVMTDQGWGQPLALAETILGMVLFASCSLYIRLRLKVLPPKDQRIKPNPDA